MIPGTAVWLTVIAVGVVLLLATACVALVWACLWLAGQVRAALTADRDDALGPDDAEVAGLLAWLQDGGFAGDGGPDQLAALSRQHQQEKAGRWPPRGVRWYLLRARLRLTPWWVLFRVRRRPWLAVLLLVVVLAATADLAWQPGPPCSAVTGGRGGVTTAGQGRAGPVRNC